MAKKDKSNHEGSGPSGDESSGPFGAGPADAGSGSGPLGAGTAGADATDPRTGSPVEDAAFVEAEGPDIEVSVDEPVSGGSPTPGVNEPGDVDDENEYSEAAEEGETVGDGEFNEDDLSFLDSVSSGETGALADAENLASERLLDLQRVTAEYANYRKRTESNREVERERTVGDVVKVLLPVLDDFDRAEKHGDLAEGPFASIAGKLRIGVERFGLKPFGAAGDVFDPQVHEAIFQQPSAEVEVATVADVVETGYYLGSSLLRAAKVVVAVPNG